MISWHGQFLNNDLCMNKDKYLHCSGAVRFPGQIAMKISSQQAGRALFYHDLSPIQFPTSRIAYKCVSLHMSVILFVCVLVLVASRPINQQNISLSDELS